MRRPVFPNIAVIFAAPARPAAGLDPAHPAAPLPGARLAARKAKFGLPDLPRYAGQNRTASKRALPRAIENSPGKW